MDQVEHGVEFVDSVCRFLADLFRVAGNAGDAAVHGGGFGDGCGDGRGDAFIEGVGDNVVSASSSSPTRDGDGSKTQPVSCLR